MTVKITKGMKVRVAIDLRHTDGTAIESSAVEYVHGAGAMLKGLEAALEGMATNETKEGVLAPKDAFGLEEDLPTKKIPRAEFPRDTRMEPGMLFEAKGPDGRPIGFKVLTVDAKEATVRLLHPLAGKSIKYKIKVLAVADPSKVPPPPAEALELAPDEIAEET